MIFARFRAAEDQQQAAIGVEQQQQPVKPQIFGVPLQVEHSTGPSAPKT